jgi:hypothetical protein
MDDEQDDSQHQRQAKRSLVLLAGKVRIEGVVHDVRLRNLSQNGALLEGEAAFPVGTLLRFERGDTAVDARVAWAAKNRFGIEFLTPIQESEVLIHIGKPSRQLPEPTPVVYRRGPIRDTRLFTSEPKPVGSFGRLGK